MTRINVVILISFLAGCVSVNLGSSNTKKSDQVLYAAPSKPFTEFKSDNLDRAWRNPQSGSSISFLSECDPNSDPSLESLKSSLVQSIDGAKEEKSNFISYNGRKAIDTVVVGQVDGVSSKFRILAFKKNNCNYILTYVALPETYEADSRAFDTFKEGFRVP